MTQTTGESAATLPGDDATRSTGARLLGVLRDVLLRFVLPVAGLGVVLWGVEEILLGFGVHGDVVKILRLGVLPIYGFMVWRMMKGRAKG